jgi:H+/Cl- antiporter ClcA
MERWTPGEVVFWAVIAVVLGAYGPLAAYERWYMRLPPKRKALYLLAHGLVVVALKGFAPGFARGVAQSSDSVD